MKEFSPKVKKFLEQVGADPNEDVSIVPKSDSCAKPGDILFFRYILGFGKGSRQYRLLLLTQPVTKDAKTGNRLLTGLTLPEDRDYDPDSLDNLYKNKEIPMENFRTYIMSKIYGPLRRIRKKETNIEE